MIVKTQGKKEEMKVTVVVMEVDGGKEAKEEECCDYYTLDGSVNFRGQPAVKGKSGGWLSGILLLVNQGLATLAFFGVNVNLVLFLTRVLQQNNEDAANNVSKWTGTVYLFSLVGAFLSDSYWGRYRTCAIFQVIFVLGLVILSLSSQLFLLRPLGCGNERIHCEPNSGMEVGIFYLSLYMIALGNGGYQPNVATFGSDQFDEEDPKEVHSKVSFFSYFYLALNLGSLFSNTILSYLEDKGDWALGFWVSSASAIIALLLFLSGTPRYRHFRPGGNPLSRVCQVAVAASRKWRVRMPSSGDDLYEADGKELADANGARKMSHTEGFKFLDRAAYVESNDFTLGDEQCMHHDPWKLCTVTQVEEVKCVLRLLPVWLCTIPYSVVFTQMASLFVVQGAAMNRTIGTFAVPPASMSAFDICTVAAVIFLYRTIIHPLACRLTGNRRGLTELQRMGIGLVVAIVAMVSAGTVEHFRLKQAQDGGTSSLNIMWQVPQYMLIGVSEVFMYVGQLEFFNNQAPDGLKSFGSALCMMSMSLGNYASDVIVTAVGRITTRDGRPGWIPADLNEGHLDRFYFMLALIATADLVLYVAYAKWYKRIKLEGKCGEDEMDSSTAS
ncbi:protein NRT1/ PTR FAMILY 7.3-like [Typha latifolia]|uniref:protein NRT1/ PTR FAMILY 7.3-like n=1 Tax=Typha latifolia TaxID=4733 RepID=UPI003C2CCE5E